MFVRSPAKSLPELNNIYSVYVEVNVSVAL